ncbi:unnamed protein product [Amoebophrya sp. A25]|nr:unnamed protein product [Amoebophrya sp. A25]|eukprot:GSA25T00027577001.1
MSDAQLEANRSKLLLEANDHVGVSYWLVAGSMAACSIFFYIQAALVPREWSLTMIIAGSVTAIAWLSYHNAKDVWQEKREAPIVARYMDWILTVPLQILEFYLLLAIATPPDRETVSRALCARLVGASIAMLAFGYMGETEIMSLWPAFVTGCGCWLYIVWELYQGEAAKLANELSVIEAKKFLKDLETQEEKEIQMASELADQDDESEADGENKDGSNEENLDAMLGLSGRKREKKTRTVVVRRDKGYFDEREFVKPRAEQAYDMLRMILLVGWAIYPASYAWYHMAGDAEGKLERENAMNALYNIGDLVNKIAFGLAVYSAAGSDEQAEKTMDYRVMRIELRIMREWMISLKKMGIVDRKFKGDIKSWLNIKGDEAAGNKEVADKTWMPPKASSGPGMAGGPGGPMNAPPGLGLSPQPHSAKIQPFSGPNSGPGMLGASNPGGILGAKPPTLLNTTSGPGLFQPAGNSPSKPALFGDNLSTSMGNVLGASMGGSMGNNSNKSNNTSGIYADVMRTIPPNDTMWSGDGSGQGLSQSGPPGYNSNSLHYEQQWQGQQWTEEEWEQWRKDRNQQWTDEEWEQWRKEKDASWGDYGDSGDYRSTRRASLRQLFRADRARRKSVERRTRAADITPPLRFFPPGQSQIGGGKASSGVVPNQMLPDLSAHESESLRLELVASQRREQALREELVELQKLVNLSEDERNASLWSRIQKLVLILEQLQENREE